MILWNIEKLKQNLVEGRVTDKDFFSYYLLASIFTSLTFISLAFPWSMDHELWEITRRVFGGAILLLACFRTHQKHCLDHFLEKFIVISLCADIRFFLITIVPKVVFNITLYRMPLTMKIIENMIGVFWSLYTYWHYRDFSKKFAASVDRI